MTTNGGVEFGELAKVPLRDAWTREDTHFTPWLAREQNLGLLGETLGLQLELVGEEKSVGPFRADILCKNVADGSMILIENQIERTDHSHLGQVITYAAGLDAVTIVWIAARFTEEHRAALDWLNDVSHENIRFFGLEVELWRIGESPVAPKFNVVARPNDWTKMVKDSAGGGANTEARALRREFWEGFLNHLQDEGSSVSSDRTPTTDHFMVWGGFGRSGISVMASVGFRDKWIDAGILVLDHDLYRQLEMKSADVHAAVGGEMRWRFDETRKQNYISFTREGIDPMNRDTWVDCWRWLREHMERCDAAVRSVLPQL